MPRRLHAQLAFCLWLACCALCGVAHAQTPEAGGSSASGAAGASGASGGTGGASVDVREANVRQVVLGIISFTRWPTSPAKVRLCVSGNTEYARDLVAGPLPASGLPVEARRLSAAEPAIGSLCDALYLGTVGDGERRQLLANIAGHPVLTISERNDSCTSGTMFCLNVDADRVTFDINLDTVARSGVRVHPNVLKLARKPGTP